MSKNIITRGQNINQINRPVLKKVIHFNTKFRDNYYNTSSTDFLYKFPLTVSNAVSVRLRSIDIPNTWYTFSNRLGNNRFIIECQIGRKCPETIIHEIVIPEGNYSAIQLTNYLNDTYLFQSGKVNELNYIKLTIDKTDLKTRFERIGSPPTVLKFNFKFVLPSTKSIMFTMGWIMGFRMGQYLNVEKNLISEGLFDGGGDRYLYISFVDFNKNRNDNNIIFLDNSFIDKDILGKIYLRDGKFHVNVDDSDGEGSLKKREFNGPVDFERIHLKLLDEYGNIIYLNNMDFSFALEFEILYEKYTKNHYRN